MGKTYHKVESVHQAKGFKSSIKKLSKKERTNEKTQQRAPGRNESASKLDLQGTQLVLDQRSPVNSSIFGHGTTS